MGLKIAVLKESVAGETRLAVSPDVIARYTDLGYQVHIQSGAGNKADLGDPILKEAGAIIAKSPAEALKNADILLCVQSPDKTSLSTLKKGALVIGQLAPYQNTSFIKDCAAAGVTAMTMELVPRISRAQSMDVLSSQANLAGYKAVLDATEHFNQAMPMMMTAAGTVSPAKVFVMGAGVAGLQAIATAKRLGAAVFATDVRPAAKEQVESLGAKFVAVEDDEFRQAETAGGYAKEMSAAYKKKQQALTEETIAKQDIVITTALIPGRPAPQLISEAMVKSMKPGSVIVDLAAIQGGNCALTEGDKVVQKHGVTIVGYHNFAGRIARTATQLYAKNLFNLVQSLTNKENGKIEVKWDDDIVKGIALTQGGKILQDQFGAKKPASKKSSAKKPASKKATVKKTPTKTTTAKKTAVKKAAVKKTATKTTKKTAPKKKTTAKKTTNKAGQKS